MGMSRKEVRRLLAWVAIWVIVAVIWALWQRGCAS